MCVKTLMKNKIRNSGHASGLVVSAELKDERCRTRRTKKEKKKAKNTG